MRQFNLQAKPSLNKLINCGLAAIALAASLSLLTTLPTGAITPIPDPDPIPGSYGLEATKPKPPPTENATITLPSGGASFSDSPIEVSGVCPDGLLVQIYNNDVMVGAVMCEDGSFSLQVSLFAGENNLTAIVYDLLDQPGPTSSAVSVTYNDTNLSAFGQLVTLTSAFGRRATPQGSNLVWPLQLSGGTGPYAFSIDWGDGSEPQLVSQGLAGNLNINHVYKNAGIYNVNIQVSDTNGVSAFLQVVAVASGQASAPEGSSNQQAETEPKPTVLWWPLIVLLVLLPTSFWLGKRSQVITIRNQMLKERDAYEKSAKENS